MELDFVNASGQPLTIGSRQSQYATRPAARLKRPPQHMGFEVVGYPPGVIGAALAENERQRALWAGYSDAERRSRIKSGERAPQPWDEATWLRKHKPKRVRLCQTPTGADECAELARRGGWDRVAVVEKVTGSER